MEKKSGRSTRATLCLLPPARSVRCLNERTPGGALNCLKAWDRRRDMEPRLESEEDDPELIIFVPFTQVHSLRRTGEDLSFPLSPPSSGIESRTHECAFCWTKPLDRSACAGVFLRLEGREGYVGACKLPPSGCCRGQGSFGRLP